MIALRQQWSAMAIKSIDLTKNINFRINKKLFFIFLKKIGALAIEILMCPCERLGKPLRAMSWNALAGGECRSPEKKTCVAQRHDRKKS